MLTSKGIKRTVTGWLATLSAILSFVPGASEILNFITAIASVLGGAGISHAFLADTLGKKKLETITSALMILVTVFQTVPQLQPYSDILLYIAGLLGISPTVKNAFK